MTNKEIKALFDGNEEQYKDFQAKFNTSPDVTAMKQKNRKSSASIPICSSNATTKEVK